MFRVLRQTTRLGLYQARWNSTASSSTPPLMATLRTDLKTAMRAKDTDRLNVLRALISEYNNSQKTASPIETDVQLLALIRKRASASKDSAQQFLEAERPDLKEKEDKAIAILEEYGSQVKTMDVEEIKIIVLEEVAKLSEGNKLPNLGLLFKALYKSGGSLDGKPVDRSVVTEISKKIVAEARAR
ncbi:hypothetical protein BJY04DRAFT_140043 [Aspergillus karnatakaensis]|uniref:uncharacterized protein n=1 Tax=Aspergillus karnatakaensis TaxID=1810916 RepID=UPI003CCD7689